MRDVRLRTEAGAGASEQPPTGAYRSLLQDGPFVRIWLVGGVAGTMRWLETLAFGVFTYQVTRSPSLAAFMTFMRLGPMLFAGLPAGALAERYDRKRLLEIGLWVLLLNALLLGLLTVTGRLEIWHLAIGAFVNGLFFTSEFPVRRTMIGEVVETRHLAPAMALDSMTSNATRALGPVIGGLLLDQVGLAGVFALGAVGYVSAILAMRRLDYRAAVAPRRVALLSGVREGVAFARQSRLVKATLLITVAFNVCGFAYIALVPVMGERILHLSAFLIGVLMSAEGIGSFLGAILVGAIATPARYTRLYAGGVAIFFAMTLAFALSANFLLSLAVLFCSGLGLAAFSVMQSTLTFVIAPRHMRPRIMGLLTVAIGTGPIGMLAVGWLAEGVGAPLAILLLEASGALVLALILIRFPDFLRVRDPTGHAAPADRTGSES